MKTIVLTIAFFVGAQLAIAQSHFENILATSTTTYSGIADGGVSYSFSYTYIAHTNLTLPYIYFDGKPLSLAKGDSVIFDGSRYQSYQPERELYPDSTTQVDTTVQKKFYAREHKGIYYVVIPYDKSWEYARKYRVGEKAYTANYKKEFDKVKAYSMP